MTIFTLAKTDTYKTSAWKQKLKVVLPKDVSNIKIGSPNVQQIAQLTGKGIRSQSGGKRIKLPRPAPFKIKASS
jgi:Flp pilus assembly secretin CpaC